MLEVVLRFGRDHGFIVLCLAAATAIIWWLCHSRLRRLRQRARLAREVEDALVQNAQGLIVKVHGLVTKLPPNDPLRIRVEQALDRADEQLCEDRDRVQTLRVQAVLDAPVSITERPRQWLDGALRWLGWNRR